MTAGKYIDCLMGEDNPWPLHLTIFCLRLPIFCFLPYPFLFPVTSQEPLCKLPISTFLPSFPLLLPLVSSKSPFTGLFFLCYHTRPFLLLPLPLAHSPFPPSPWSPFTDLAAPVPFSFSAVPRWNWNLAVPSAASTWNRCRKGAVSRWLLISKQVKSLFLKRL